MDVKKHAALMVMFLGSVSSFLIQIVARAQFSDELYSWFALYILFIGYLGTLSFMASDNVLIRYTNIQDEALAVPKKLGVQLFVSWCVAGLVLTIIGQFLIKKTSLFGVYDYTLPFIFVSITVVFSIYHRLKSEFFKSQLYLQYWKPVFLVALLIFVALKFEFSKQLVQGILLGALFIVMFIAALNFNKIHKSVIFVDAKEKSSEYINMQFGYILALLYLAFSGSLDRLILADNLTIKDFANYAYMVTLLIYPIGLIANYIGFKQLVYIKQGIAVDVRQKMLKLSLFGGGLYLFYSAALWLISPYIHLEIDPIIWAAVFISVIAKMSYTVCSAMISAKAVAKEIKNMNYISMLILIIVAAISYQYPNKYLVIYLISFLWATRICLSYRIAIRYSVRH